MTYYNPIQPNNEYHGTYQIALSNGTTVSSSNYHARYFVPDTIYEMARHISANEPNLSEENNHFIKKTFERITSEVIQIWYDLATKHPLLAIVPDQMNVLPDGRIKPAIFELVTDSSQTKKFLNPEGAARLSREGEVACLRISQIVYCLFFKCPAPSESDEKREMEKAKFKALYEMQKQERQREISERTQLIKETKAKEENTVEAFFRSIFSCCS